MTAEEVARMLAVSEGWVQEQSRAGRIPTVRLGRYRRYRREAIEEWLRDVEELSTRRGRPASLPPRRSRRRPIGAAAHSSAWRLTVASMPPRAPVSGHVRLRHGKRGDVFYVKFRLPDGRQVVRRLGPEWRQRGRPPSGYYTRRTAEVALREILADAQRDRLPGQVRTGAKFGDAVCEWLRYVEHDRQRAASTVADYRGVAYHALLPEFGQDTPLEAITVDRIDDYRARLQREGRLSNRTITKHLVMLGGIFKRGQRVWGLPGNPARGVERPPVHRTGDFRVLTPMEVEMLATAAESQQDGALFTTAAFSGLRMGELRALRWADVDFEKRLLRARRSFTRLAVGDPKSHRVRSVPMVDTVARRLAELSARDEFTASDDLVFPNSFGNFLDDSRLRRRFLRALERAGLKRLRFHELRHTFGTLAVQVFPLSDVMAYMGHADIQTTMCYVHHVPRHDAAEQLSRLVRAAGH